LDRKRREENFMKGLLAVGLVGTLLGIELLGGSSSECAELERGKALYANKCQICHGPKGDGKGPAAAAFTPRPTVFTNSQFWQENDAERIAETIKKGRGAMPALDLKPDETQAIIDHMAHSFKKGGK
jgi:mono/diheme cytochrome c family protein